jgi:hypothetical protein
MERKQAEILQRIKKLRCSDLFTKSKRNLNQTVLFRRENRKLKNCSYMKLNILSNPIQGIISNQALVTELNITVKFVCNSWIEFILDNLAQPLDLEFENFFWSPEVEKSRLNIKG